MKPPCPPPALPLTLVWHVSPSGSLSQQGGLGKGGGIPGDAGRPAGATSASWQSARARLSSSTETRALSAGLGVLPCSSHLQNGLHNHLSITGDSVSPQWPPAGTEVTSVGADSAPLASQSIFP